MKKTAFVIRCCVGIFQLQVFYDCVNARSSTKVGPIDHHVAPFGAASAKTTESMEVQLAVKWSCRPGFFCAVRLSVIVCLV